MGCWADVFWIANCVLSLLESTCNLTKIMLVFLFKCSIGNYAVVVLCILKKRLVYVKYGKNIIVRQRIPCKR